MGKLMTAQAGRLAFGEIAAMGITPAGLEQYKIDRLLELRALIDSLRAEHGNELTDVRAAQDRPFCR